MGVNSSNGCYRRTVSEIAFAFENSKIFVPTQDEYLTVPLFDRSYEIEDGDEGECLNQLEYKRGERRFVKDVYENGEFCKTVVCDLQSYRIDTSKLGKNQVVILYPIANTNMYKKSIVDIMVIEEKAEELVLFSKPMVTTYEINSNELKLDGLILIVRYDNGTAKVLSNGENGTEKLYTESFDFSEVGKSTVTLQFNELSKTFDVDVICYHKDTVVVENTDATCGNNGYTEGIYCNDCKTYISGHEEIPSLSKHPYGDWEEYSEVQHIRECVCGEKEYAAHSWDDGVETLAPTYTTEGEKTYTCGDCGATKIEKLPIWDMPEDAPKVIVSSKNAVVGGTVQIAISIENNPGIWSMAFELPIDTDVFEFVSDDKSASIFKQFGICGYDANKNVYKFNGYNGDLMNNITADGTLVVITLKVKETAEIGKYKLCAMLSERDIVNVDENMVSFASTEGTVEICEYVLGDVNGDGYITNADVLKIFRYIYNPAIYPLTEEVADVNRDGYVTNADVLKIFRYIYNPELYPIG